MIAAIGRPGDPFDVPMATLVPLVGVIQRESSRRGNCGLQWLRKGTAEMPRGAFASSVGQPQKPIVGAAAYFSGGVNSALPPNINRCRPSGGGSFANDLEQSSISTNGAAVPALEMGYSIVSEPQQKREQVY